MSITDKRRGGRVSGRVGVLQARGFTLVELLVVIGIIALVTAILVPSLSMIRGNARTITCQSKLRQIGVAAVAYARDYDGWTPRDAYSNNDAFFAPLFAKYMAMAEPPQDGPIKVGSRTRPRVQADFAYCQQWLRGADAFHCPSLEDQDRLLDYAINALDFNYYLASGGYQEKQFQRLFGVPNSAKTVHLFEVNAQTLSATAIGQYNLYLQTDLTYLSLPHANAGQPSPTSKAITAGDNRHGGRTTLLYFDGHVELRDFRAPGSMPLSLLNPYAP